MDQRYTQEFGLGGSNKFSWGQRTENRDVGAVDSYQGFWRQLLFGKKNCISYSKIFLIFGNLKLFLMTTYLFVIENVKQLQT